MFPFKIKYFAPLFVGTIALFPVLSAMGLKLFDSLVMVWGGVCLNLAFIFWYKQKYFRPENRKDYRIVWLFLVLAAVGIVRGAFVADNYWEWKRLTGSAFQLMLPAFVYVFSTPELLQKVLRLWLKFIFPLFLLVLTWIVLIDAYQFYLAPIFLLGCFLPIVPVKWRFAFIVLLGVMLLGDLGARAQIMKAGAALLIAVGVGLRRQIPRQLLRMGHWALYVVPVLLLTLGISGVYNIFEDSMRYAGQLVRTDVGNEHTAVKDITTDTRTFIYREVIGSARTNDYLFWGRTPARGNDSEWFGAYNAEELNTGKYERHTNEVGHLNVFTWLGLAGLALWCLAYLKSSFLAVYRSRNVFMRYMGVFIAFRFLLGWIEDVNNFDLGGIAIWMAIAMGFSQQFRSMSDEEFKKWLRGCFPVI